MVAALYVCVPGCYTNLPGVDPWPETRDARRYVGPWSVVAHPPCQRWGRLWRTDGSTTPGQDAGCFAAALAAVRRWGGVLEHPSASKAWPAHCLPRPDPAQQWTAPDAFGGRSIHVEQGHYGHRARKATWLYAVSRSTLPALARGKSAARAYLMQPGRCSRTKPRATCPCVRCETLHGADWRGQHNRGVPRLTARENEQTPIPFRDILLRIAMLA